MVATQQTQQTQPTQEQKQSQQKEETREIRLMRAYMKTIPATCSAAYEQRTLMSIVHNSIFQSTLRAEARSLSPSEWRTFLADMLDTIEILNPFHPRLDNSECPNVLWSWVELYSSHLNKTLYRHQSQIHECMTVFYAFLGHAGGVTGKQLSYVIKGTVSAIKGTVSAICCAYMPRCLSLIVSTTNIQLNDGHVFLANLYLAIEQQHDDEAAHLIRENAHHIDLINLQLPLDVVTTATTTTTTMKCPVLIHAIHRGLVKTVAATLSYMPVDHQCSAWGHAWALSRNQPECAKRLAIRAAVRTAKDVMSKMPQLVMQSILKTIKTFPKEGFDPKEAQLVVVYVGIPRISD